MKKDPAKRKKVSVNKYKTGVEEYSQNFKEGQFLLNPNGLDRLSFKGEIDTTTAISKVSNVSYEIFHSGEWEWVIRYDDHGGDGRLHRHERISLRDSSEFPIPVSKAVKRAGSRQKWFNWAIRDIKNNYLVYRKKLLRRCNLDLY